jgi:hypothetical protein
MTDQEIQRERRRREAKAYGEWYSNLLATDPEFAESERLLIERTNEMSLRGGEW